MFAQPGETTFYVFHIDDQERAEQLHITAHVLKTACERAFETVIIRCQNQHGARDESPEQFEMEKEHEDTSGLRSCFPSEN